MTGNASSFTPANFTDGKSSVTSYGADSQATLAVFKGARLTTGIGYLRDSSADQFTRFDFSSNASAPRSVITGRASTPDSTYRNLSWSNLFEYEPLGRVRLSGGFRVDNWRTEAKVTRGFPLGTEAAILNASFNALRTERGGINVEGASGILDLVNGPGGIKTSKTSVTGNAGLVLRLPGFVNPYFRWETSYREPGITERYILRDFGDQTFSILLLPNTALKPERGNTYEVGVKVQRTRLTATLNYFRNNLQDFIRNEFSPVLFVPPDPQNGLRPVSPFFPFHGVLYVQRANTARARIQGVEANYEASLSLSGAGSITPFGTIGWLKGSNLTPDQQTLTLINDFYNRPDTLIPLRGSAEDAPLAGISPFGGFFGVRYSDRRGSLFGEYDIHYRARVTRADPVDLTTSIGTQYGTFASLNSSLTQALRVGYNFRRERYRLLLAFGVDNLTNRLYFEPFQTAPAPGRSLVFGLTLDAFDLLRH
jgi:outer membrane receptor protein involved in Fe transport